MVLKADALPEQHVVAARNAYPGPLRIRESLLRSLSFQKLAKCHPLDDTILPYWKLVWLDAMPLHVIEPVRCAP